MNGYFRFQFICARISFELLLSKYQDGDCHLVNSSVNNAGHCVAQCERKKEENQIQPHSNMCDTITLSQLTFFASPRVFFNFNIEKEGKRRKKKEKGMKLLLPGNPPTDFSSSELFCVNHK